jgi:ribonuclease BN (tRNA processing enzyme)
MEIIVLGASAAYPGPDNPCSGYLLRQGDSRLLIDCGCGVLGNLQKHIDLRRVDNIIVSHMHPDHFFDLIPYRYALRYGLQKEAGLPGLYLPPGGAEVLKGVAIPFAETDDFFVDVFRVRQFDPAEKLQLGPFTVEFTAVHHYIDAYALSVTAGRKLAYSSDTGMCPELVQVAMGADMFLCTVGRCLGEDIASLWGHMLPQEAGAVARQAGARRLMLTHLWPDCDRDLCLQQASDAFGGRAELALANRSYELGAAIDL